MTNSETLENFLQQYPQTKYLDVFYCDLSCVIRGKRYPISQAKKVFESGIMSPGSSFLLAVNGESMDPEGMGFSDGDPDELGMPLTETLSPATWAQIPTAQVMLSMQSLAGEHYYFEPRNVLRRVLDRFSELDLHPVVAFELEFYLLDPGNNETSNKDNIEDERITPPKSPLTGRRTDTTQVYSMDDLEDFSLYLDDVTSTCALQGVTTGAISGEYSPGQFEINLQHSDRLLEAADQCIMFRRAVKSIARKHGFEATFMSKPYAENSGSGLHLHVSLLDKQGNNVFDGGGEYGTLSCASDTLLHGIGGLKTLMPDSMGIFAPNTNSYQRFVPNIYVPVTASWGFENRSVAIRIPKSPGDARRIEHRVAGADANPYLTLAAILAGIHYGISERVDSGKESIGNAGEKLDPDVPFTLESAQKRTRKSKILGSYFGEQYLRAYTSCKLREYQAFTESKDPQTKWYL